MTAISRRTMLGAGAIAAVVLAVGAAVIEAPRFIARRYPRTPYDDLLSQLSDREAAACVGHALARNRTRFNLNAMSQMLRARIRNGDLAGAAGADLAAGRLREAGGWVLPESVALLCAIAAGA